MGGNSQARVCVFPTKLCEIGEPKVVQTRDTPKNTNTASEVAPFLHSQHIHLRVYTSAFTHWTPGVPLPCSLFEALANHNIKGCRNATRTDLILFPATLPLGSTGNDVAWQARSAQTCFGTLDTPRTGSHQDTAEDSEEPSEDLRSVLGLFCFQTFFYFKGQLKSRHGN